MQPWDVGRYTSDELLRLRASARARAEADALNRHLLPALLGLRL